VARYQTNLPTPGQEDRGPSEHQDKVRAAPSQADAQVVADQLADILDSQEAGAAAVRGSALRFGAFVAGLLFSLAAVPFMTRHLGPVDYGLYVAATSTVLLLGGITEAGLTNLGLREISVLRGAARDELLSNLVGLRIGLTVIGVLTATAITWTTGAEPEIVEGIWIVGIGVLLVVIQQTYMIPLSAQLRLGWVSAMELLRQGALNGFFLAFVITGLGLIAFFWAQVLAGAIVLVATLLLIRQHASLRPSFEWRVWRRVLRETLPYAVAAAVGILYFRLAVLLMSYVSTGHETGIFSAAFRIVEALAIIPPLLVSSLFPILARAARDDHGRLAYALQRIFEVALIIGTGIALTLAIAAPFAIRVVAGTSFDDSVPVLRIQALTMITAFLLATWNFGLLSLKRFRELMLANLVSAGVAVVGTLTLAPPLGAEGAAIATVAAEGAVALASLYYLHRTGPAFAPSLGVVPKVAFAAGAGVVIAVVLPAWPAVALSAIAGVVFAAIVFATGALPPEVLGFMRRRRGFAR
jgi:O-antigen/teichoic acid export membrane protein